MRYYPEPDLTRHCSYYWYCLISWQATNVNCILFGLFRPGIELVIQIYDSNYNRHSVQTLGNRPCKFRECPENYLHTKQKVDFIRNKIKFLSNFIICFSLKIAVRLLSFFLHPSCQFFTYNNRGRRGRVRMVGGFATTCAISAYQH